MHAGLNNLERECLVDEFNNPESPLKVLVITYDIGLVGLNLHTACNLVVLSAPGKSWSQEAQAFGRCLRVTSKYDLHVIRINVPESHDQFCNNRQAKKASLQLAVSAREPEIQSLLLKLLQELQLEVDLFWTKSEATELRRKTDEEEREYDARLAVWLDQKARERGIAAGPSGESQSPERRSVGFVSDEENLSSDDDLFVEEDFVGPEVPDKGKGCAVPSDTEASEEDEDEMDLSESLKQSRRNARKQKEKDEEAFTRIMEWKKFAASVQPDAQTRHKMALINIPPNKIWTKDDLHDPKHPEWFELALRLLYQKIRGVQMLNLGSAIHIRYSEISPLQQGKIDAMVESLMDPKSEKVLEEA